jgi:integrase/recombinase XerD
MPRARAARPAPVRPPSASPAIAAFLAYLATERGLAANTISAYRSDLEGAAAFLAARALQLPATPDDLRAYLRSESSKGRATKTVARRHATLRVFLKHLAANGMEVDRHLEAIEAPKPARPLPKIISHAQVDRLLAAPPAGPHQLRDVAILELLYAAGVRASELCDLELGAVDLVARCVRVMGKGSKERVVPFGERARATLEQYLASAPPRVAGHGRVFVSRTGRPLDRVALYKLVRRHARAAGLPSNVTPHTMRHCFASHLVAGGADLRVVQELLGHSDVATTQVYTHVDHSRLKELHTRCLPR